MTDQSNAAQKPAPVAPAVVTAEKSAMASLVAAIKDHPKTTLSVFAGLVLVTASLAW